MQKKVERYLYLSSRARGRYKNVLAGWLQDATCLSDPGCPQPLLVQWVCLDEGEGRWPWWLKKGTELPSGNKKKVFFSVGGCRDGFLLPLS